jgi:hypothetical protein
VVKSKKGPARVKEDENSDSGFDGDDYTSTEFTDTARSDLTTARTDATDDNGSGTETDASETDSATSGATASGASTAKAGKDKKGGKSPARSRRKSSTKDLRKHVLAGGSGAGGRRASKFGAGRRSSASKGGRRGSGGPIRGGIIQGLSKVSRSRREPWDEFTSKTTDMAEMTRLKTAFTGDIYDVKMGDDDEEDYLAMAGDESKVGDKFIHLRRKMSLSSLYNPDERLAQLSDMTKEYKETVEAEIEERDQSVEFFA